MNSNNYNELIEFMTGMEIVDTHEHLSPEKDRIAAKVDFSTLFSHYCLTDLKSSGMTPDEMTRFYSADASVADKWQLFEPYYNLIHDGGYAHAAHIAMEQFYGYSRLESVADAEAVTKAMREANKPGLYKKVLKDACHIRMSMNFGSLDDDPEFFAPVLFANSYSAVNKATIRNLEDTLDVSCGNLSSYVDGVYELFRQYKDRGLKGIKFSTAYERDVSFAPRTHAEAEKIYQRVVEEGYGWRGSDIGYEESRPLQDYMVHRFVELAGELDLPMVFHTGLQTDMEHKAEDTRPLQLWNLPHRYRNVDFIILHGGCPWMEDCALLAKQYRNVYLDLAWTHIMSPSIASRYLQSWIDLVPMNKVSGFGGDYIVIEKVYGHLVIARENIARALAAKIEDGAMNLDRAKAWIRAMLWDNPKRVYRLDI